MSDGTWTCDTCRSEQTDALVCLACHAPRYPTWAVMFATHITEHLADGLTEPLAVLIAMQARPCYARLQLELSTITQHLRLLTKDTTKLAREIVKARAAAVMLDVLATGDSKDKIQVLRHWGPETNTERVDVQQTVTSRVVEIHEGKPPERGDA